MLLLKGNLEIIYIYVCIYYLVVISWFNYCAFWSMGNRSGTEEVHGSRFYQITDSDLQIAKWDWVFKMWIAHLNQLSNFALQRGVCREPCNCRKSNSRIYRKCCSCIFNPFLRANFWPRRSIIPGTTFSVLVMKQNHFYNIKRDNSTPNRHETFILYLARNYLELIGWAQTSSLSASCWHSIRSSCFLFSLPNT